MSDLRRRQSVCCSACCFEAKRGQSTRCRWLCVRARAHLFLNFSRRCARLLTQNARRSLAQFVCVRLGHAVAAVTAAAAIVRNPRVILACVLASRLQTRVQRWQRRRWQRRRRWRRRRRRRRRSSARAFLRQRAMVFARALAKRSALFNLIAYA